MESPLEATRAIYQWLVDNAPSLSARLVQVREGIGDVTLTPRLELRAHANGPTYDVTVGFFVEYPCHMKITLLPDEHRATLAAFVSAPVRTTNFATIRPATPGSSVLECKHFVWDEMLLDGVAPRAAL